MADLLLLLLISSGQVYGGEALQRREKHFVSANCEMQKLRSFML